MLIFTPIRTDSLGRERDYTFLNLMERRLSEDTDTSETMSIIYSGNIWLGSRIIRFDMIRVTF